MDRHRSIWSGRKTVWSIGRKSVWSGSGRKSESSRRSDRKSGRSGGSPDTNTSILPTFLQHLVEGDLKGFQAELCDFTSSDSDLDLEWNVDIEIISQQDKTLDSIRPHSSEHSGHSILLDVSNGLWVS
jgi:hypothetical protein